MKSRVFPDFKSKVDMKSRTTIKIYKPCKHTENSAAQAYWSHRVGSPCKPYLAQNPCQRLHVNSLEHPQSWDNRPPNRFELLHASYEVTLIAEHGPQEQHPHCASPWSVDPSFRSFCIILTNSTRFSEELLIIEI